MTISKEEKEYDIKVTAAAREYLDRKDRVRHPAGKTDNAGRWYPSDAEWCDCCEQGRSPSRAYPWSLMTHCRTAEHVANHFGVKKTDLTRAARRLQAEEQAEEVAGEEQTMRNAKYTSPIRAQVDADLLALAQRQAESQMTALAPLMRAGIAQYLCEPHKVAGGASRQPKGGTYALLQFTTTADQREELQSTCKALDVSLTNVLTEILINIVHG